MAERAHAKGALGHSVYRPVSLVERYSAMVPRLGRARLLRMEGRCEGVNLALKLSDATVGLFLSLACRWSRDASHC